MAVLSLTMTGSQHVESPMSCERDSAELPQLMSCVFFQALGLLSSRSTSRNPHAARTATRKASLHGAGAEKLSSASRQTVVAFGRAPTAGAALCSSGKHERQEHDSRG